MQKILIIQTAFIGDVILATALIEKIYAQDPKVEIDFLLRKGNEALLQGHPYLNKLLIFDKKKHKYKNLLRLLRGIRRRRYDRVINVQRFFTTGLITAFSRGRYKVGFDKNPWSSWFDKSVVHEIDQQKGTMHETDRNQLLIADFVEGPTSKPKLYPSESHFSLVETYKAGPYVCMAPTSVWWTKQFPIEKWVELIQSIPKELKIYLLGAPGDVPVCNDIKLKVGHRPLEVLAGKLNLLESAALMKDARMNYVNDSAPLHLCSAMDAPTCAIFCSTVPHFGFGPLSEKSYIAEIQYDIPCRPCGLHGHSTCPEGHFKCGREIEIEQLKKVLIT